MNTKHFEQDINLQGIETVRSYMTPRGCIVIEQPSTLRIKASGEHQVTDEVGEIFTIPATWYAFHAIAPSGEFSFNVVKQGENPDMNIQWKEFPEDMSAVMFALGEQTYTITEPSHFFEKSSGSIKIVDKVGDIHYLRNGFKQICAVDA
jgi:hypothetical protein